MRKVLYILIFVFSVSYAQENKFTAVLDHVSISVNNVDSSAHYYQKILNLNEITNRTKKEGIRWFSLGDGKELHLISVVPGEIKLNKAIHFAVSVINFDDFVQNLRDRGIPFSDWAGTSTEVTFRADGIKQVYIQDPDGYYIEVNSIIQ